MKANDGTEMERLVAMIEQMLAPSGFQVQTRRRVFTEEGLQAAEFDIEVAGRIGSADYRGLIECRDRPSKGPAPGSWIEQLDGRRSRFNFSSVIAVSSTGFTSEAMSYARSVGIQLRSLNEMTPTAFTKLIPGLAPIVIHDRHLVGIEIYCSTETAQDEKPAMAQIPGKFETAATIFSRKSTGQRLSITDLWQADEVPSAEYEECEQLGIRKTVRIEASTKLLEDLFVDSPSGPHPVANIAYIAEIWATHPSMELVNAVDYVSSAESIQDEKTHASAVKWKCTDENPLVRELQVIVSRKLGDGNGSS